MRPLRIFVVHASALPTDYMPHGDGLLAYRYITELAARGHELVVAVEACAIRNPVPENVTLIDVGSRTDDGRISYMRKVRKLFIAEHAKRPFDLAHQLNPVFCGLSLALFGQRIPRVLGPYVSSWPDAGTRRLTSMIIRTLRFLEQSQSAAVILAGTQAESNVVYPFAKRSIIPYGIDTEVFAPLPQIAATRPTIIWLGPIAYRKGIITFIQALHSVRSALPNVLARIAGTGEEHDEMMATIASYDLEEHVEIMGSIPRAGVPEYLASGHLLCQPSVGEPYGMSIVEAMAIGRPIVATAAGGFLDTVDPEGGMLVPVHAPDALAAALIRVLSDTALAQTMGAYNITKAKQYEWAHVTDQIELLYATLIPGLRLR